MEKIVFVEPKSDLPGFLNLKWYRELPMLGPVYLGTILKEKGYDVEIYKEAIKEPDYQKLDCDVLGLYTLTSTSSRAYMIADYIKKKNPKCKVIIGGPHASALPHEAIKHADHVVVGESEDLIVDLIEGKIKDRIVYGNKIEDLDKLPLPDYSLVKGRTKKGYWLPVLTSRGCPFHCKFCSVTAMFGKKYRFRSAENIVKEFLSSDFGRIFFYDDNLCANKPRAKELFRLMKEKGIHKPWFSQTRIDVAKDDELLKLMVDTNVNTLFLGIESLNQESLNSYNKRQEVADIKYAVKKLKDYGIKIMGSFVLGSDGDDKNTVKGNIDFCNDLEIDYPQFTILTPLPGTELYSELDKQGRIFTKDWNLYDILHVVFKPLKMNAYDLQTNLVDAYKKTYNLFNRRTFRLLSENVFNVKELFSFRWLEIRKMVKDVMDEKLSYINKLKALKL